MECVVAKLMELQDLQYRDFVSKLTPSVDKEKIIGVRVPQLRVFAKAFANTEDKNLFLRELPHIYYEENNLHAILLLTISKNITEVMEYVEQFLPYIDNWATCDTLTPKIFAKHPDIVKSHVCRWIRSEHTYTVRFGIVTLLHFFLDDNFDMADLELVASICSDEYYINMAIAWYYSFAFIKQYHATLPIFENKHLNKWVHNKSIQKAIESYRIDDEKKQYLRSLKL